MAKTSYQLAQEYVAKGWAPIPIPHRQKSPTAAGWDSLRLSTPEQLLEHFGSDPLNIGILTGEPSNDLVDVDIDVHEALPFADAFLPQSAVFGRKGKKDSHRLYVCPTETRKFGYKLAREPEPGEKQTVSLIEIRSTGCQTVFPGSVHPSGEPIQWNKNSTAPVSIEPDVLHSQVSWVAAGALLGREWPKEEGNSRNAMYMALIGGMMNCGWEQDYTKRFIECLCDVTNDKDKHDRLLIVKATFEKGKKEKKYTGWKTLAEHLNKDHVLKVREWLDLEVASGAEFELTDLGNAKRLETIIREYHMHNADKGELNLWE